ncbi:patatin-like phospholipase family protein [Candidatus Peregrinibacteria bacterium]|nr:patatin-like phospholipase family protein [Candidatus Peregrinibacteria bacterium]
MSKAKRSWGLVLSGGAACGLANAGVLEVLDREGYVPDTIAGSSMGAIVGALYALGLRTKDLKKLTEFLKMGSVATLTERPLEGGLHGGVLKQNIEAFLSPLVGDATIGDTKIPFVCVAGLVKSPIHWKKIVTGGFTDHVMRSIDLHIFPKKTRLIDALLATSAIPVVFSPADVSGQTFVDLCHFGSIPARTLRSVYQPEVVIGTDTTPRYEKIERYLPPPWQEFLRSGYACLDESRGACDLTIEPEMPASLFRFDKATEFWSAGKEAAEKVLPEIRSLLT